MSELWFITELSKSQSQSYLTSDGQSASLSWCQAPIWGLRPDFYYCQTVAGLLMWGALFDERMGLLFTIAAGSRQRSHSWVQVLWDSWPYFTVSDRDSPNLEGQIPVFISPRNRVSQLYPQALGSLFVASYDSQGYGGGIQTCLHAGSSCYIALGWTTAQKTHLLPSNGYMQTHTENISCDIGSIVVCMYCRRCLEMGLLYYWLSIYCGLVYWGVP
jgi:hypothetical protein